jgi:methionyl-tRNA formyltransferase
MRIVFMGSPHFVCPMLELLQRNGHEIAAVYTRPDKPAGRGREPAAPPVKASALAMGLTVLQVPGFKNPENVDQLAAFHPQAIVVAAYGSLLPQKVLDIAPLGCINVHPSLLPRYRGPSPVVSAMLAGDDYVGVSVMQLDAGMDSGPVIARAQIPVLDIDDAPSLTAKLFEIGARMVLEVLAVGKNSKIPLEFQDSGLAIITRETTKEDGCIDWSRSAQYIWRQVRAYQPWPQAYTSWQGKIIKIHSAHPLDQAVALPPGQVNLAPDGVSVIISTGSGCLQVETLQIEGKKVVSAEDFVRGQRNFIGSCLL